MVRTSLAEETLGVDTGYKVLACVGRAFRSLKTAQPEERPLYSYGAEHVGGHVSLCIRVYCFEWHLWRKLPLMLVESSE